MKAIIFNSGIGKRMGKLTERMPKGMLKLSNGESLFERQIRLLGENGIRDFIITSGPFEEQLIEITRQKAYKNFKFTFVRNTLYDKTNYIYSFYLARDLLDDDFVMLHGDLVFNDNLVRHVLDAPFPSTCLINSAKKLPEKDFKGRIVNNKLKEVSINIFDNNCFALQPFYKLSKDTIKLWMKNVEKFIEEKGKAGVYAEEALNEITDNLNIIPLSYQKYYIEEIDNLDDYDKVKSEIREVDYKEQRIETSINKIKEYLEKLSLSKPLVVIDKFLEGSSVYEELRLNFSPVFFSEFHSNPDYQEVIKARKCLLENNCDSIISVGGGSAIDIAKTVKLWLPLSEEKDFFSQDYQYINFKHVAVPTTAGTGSESTRFAVVYYNGEKKSLTSDSIIPDLAILDDRFLSTLPLAQKRATMLDALCQATESLWSVNSTEQSVIYAQEAIRLITNNAREYMDGDVKLNALMLRAANLAGKAINISQTTAAHAMSYKITSTFGISHGLAVAACLIPLWHFYNSFYISHLDKIIDNGQKKVRRLISDSYSCASSEEALLAFETLCKEIGFNLLINSDKNTFLQIVDNVNIERLKNFPLELTKKDIIDIYKTFISI